MLQDPVSDNQFLYKFFLEHTFPELKAFYAQFLTVISGVIVLSTTFAEKIIDFPNATQNARRLLVASWWLLVLSLVTCGMAYWYLAMVGIESLGRQASMPATTPLDLRFARYSYVLASISGMSFLIGVATLVVVGSRSALTRRSTSN
jgi:hypothetical protein